ncbi:hypothetical protein WMY93_018702 [Mugilogobius chulae]|uniref:Protein kinase domain-containing protein n=1 Tax=Mugilogobius chulae TaxID=88201 RepID=A0AAW0NKX7_9GOBI
MDPGAAPLCYELLAEIGEGSYGKVYKARETAGRLCGSRGPSMDLTLVLEYIDQDLSSYLSKARPWPHPDCIKCDAAAASGPGLLAHKHGSSQRPEAREHFDQHRGEVKIADFGLARIYTFNIALTPGVVTLWYRAPEVLLNSVYMSSVDIWSAGCIFAELFLLRPLFQGYTEVQQLQKIFEVIGFPSEEDWPKDSPLQYQSLWVPASSCTNLLSNLGPDENDLLSQCLAFKPSSRISAAKALAHPFFMKE